MRTRFRPLIVLAVLAGLAGGCGGPTVDLTTGLEVTDVSSGWYDAGIVDGKNKLVPSITFKLRNVSDQELRVLQVNAIFKRLNEDDEWGSGFAMVVGSEGLAPGASTEETTLRSHLGYTGTETRAQMLQNSQFVDARVQLFAKYGSTQWAPLGEHPITRELITQ